VGEALWSQNVGVEYSAAEDRRLIGAIWGQGSHGVLNGLTVTPGTGRTVNISAGRAVVSDGTGTSGGAYLVYFDSVTTNLAIAANAGAPRTDGIYLTVDDPGDGNADIIAVTSDTPTPTDHYVKLATVLVGTGATSFVQANINNAVRFEALDPRYSASARFTYGTAAPPATLAVGYVYMQHD
jgi:hypothetical protein